jgi:hypothetical protein
MKYITRTITTMTATATLYDGENIVKQEIDVSSCRANDRVIEKFIEKETDMKVLNFEIRQSQALYRMSIEDFRQNAEIVETAKLK